MFTKNIHRINNTIPLFEINDIDDYNPLIIITHIKR